MKRITKHLPHYVPLIGIMVAGVIGFIIFSYDRTFQVAIVVSLTISYVVWGIIHHILHRDLDLSVVIEYLLIATLGLLVILSLIYRA